MAELRKNRFSQYEWQDAYYDGIVEMFQGYDEIHKKVFDINDKYTYELWGLNSLYTKDGINGAEYIEDASDDWYIEMMRGDIL